MSPISSLKMTVIICLAMLLAFCTAFPLQYVDETLETANSTISKESLEVEIEFENITDTIESDEIDSAEIFSRSDEDTNYEQSLSAAKDKAPLAPVTTGHAPLAPIATGHAPLAPIATGHAPLAPVASGHAPLAPIATGHAPLAPIASGHAPLAPIATGHAPLAPIASGHAPLAPIATGHAPLAPIASGHAPLAPVAGEYPPTKATPENDQEVTSDDSVEETENESESSSKEDQLKGKKGEVFNFAGTMPRFGKAFGPLRPPPRVEEKKNSAQDLSIDESASDRRKVGEPKNHTGAPKLQDNSYNYSKKPTNYYDNYDLYSADVSEFPVIPEQPILPPQIPYYNEVRINDSVTRVDYLLTYDVGTHGPSRFSGQEDANDGLIQGEFGFQASSGVIRGVRYTADPSIHPQLLYDTLVKFLAL